MTGTGSLTPAQGSRITSMLAYIDMCLSKEHSINIDPHKRVMREELVQAVTRGYDINDEQFVRQFIREHLRFLRRLASETEEQKVVDNVVEQLKANMPGWPQVDAQPGPEPYVYAARPSRSDSGPRMNREVFSGINTPRNPEDQLHNRVFAFCRRKYEETRTAMGDRLAVYGALVALLLAILLSLLLVFVPLNPALWFTLGILTVVLFGVAAGLLIGNRWSALAVGAVFLVILALQAPGRAPVPRFARLSMTVPTPSSQAISRQILEYQTARAAEVAALEKKKAQAAQDSRNRTRRTGTLAARQRTRVGPGGWCNVSDYEVSRGESLVARPQQIAGRTDYACVVCNGLAGCSPARRKPRKP